MKRLVFMIDLSLPQANALYNTANVVLILGAFLVLLGTIVAIWTGGIRERFGNERLSNNETETARAKADAAKADAHAAEVNLELAKLKAPRTLGGEQQQRLVSQLRPFSGQTFSFTVVPDTEPLALMSMIRTVLVSSGWVRVPSQLGDIEVDGAGVAYGPAVEIQMPPIGNANAWERAKFLSAALTAEGVIATAKLNPALKDDQAINVMVGRKP
jgi:hypothetical protein